MRKRSVADLSATNLKMSVDHDVSARHITLDKVVNLRHVGMLDHVGAVEVCLANLGP